MGRIHPLGVRSRWRYLASLSVAMEATVLPLVGTIADSPLCISIPLAEKMLPMRAGDNPGSRRLP